MKSQLKKFKKWLKLIKSSGVFLNLIIKPQLLVRPNTSLNMGTTRSDCSADLRDLQTLKAHNNTLRFIPSVLCFPSLANLL